MTKLGFNSTHISTLMWTPAEVDPCTSLSTFLPFTCQTKGWNRSFSKAQPHICISEVPTTTPLMLMKSWTSQHLQSHPGFILQLSLAANDPLSLEALKTIPQNSVIISGLWLSPLWWRMHSYTLPRIHWTPSYLFTSWARHLDYATGTFWWDSSPLSIYVLLTYPWFFTVSSPACWRASASLKEHLIFPYLSWLTHLLTWKPPVNKVNSIL